MQLKVGRKLMKYESMYHYYKATKDNILTQTAAETLSEALSITMKKLTLKARKNFKNKLERSQTASYSVEIAIKEAKERDEDEYSIIGTESHYEEIVFEEVNNNVFNEDYFENYDSFDLLRKSLQNFGRTQIIEETASLDGPEALTTEFDDHEEMTKDDENISIEEALDSFTKSTEKYRNELKLKMPDPEEISIIVRDKFSLGTSSSITLPIIKTNEVKQQPKSAPSNQQMEREWKKVMNKYRKHKRHVSM